MAMTPERWNFISEYAREVFGRQDDQLAHLMVEAVQAGLPDISVSSDVGRLLMMLTSMTPGRLAIELGTLAGYSGIWITRGLAPEGRLITIEKDPDHADFARRQFKRAGIGERVEIRVGAALDVLPRLADELGPESVDVVFLDAVKTEYPDYFRIARPLVVPGGLLLADNVYGTATTWIDQSNNPSIRGVDEFNRLVAADPGFEAVAVPIQDGVLLARRATA